MFRVDPEQPLRNATADRAQSGVARPCEGRQQRPIGAIAERWRETYSLGDPLRRFGNSARVQSGGVMNGVTISEATYARVKGAVDCDDLGSVAAKGKSIELRRFHVKKVR